MITARRFQVSGEEERAWNDQLSKCCNRSIFSTYQWGQFKSQNWRIERICFYNEQTFVGQTQILFKKLGPFQLGWCASGVNITEYRYLQESIDALARYFDLRRTYIRFNFLDEATGEVEFTFDEIESLRRVSKPINSGYTIRFFNLNSESIENYNRNNRYYLKKAIAKNLRFEYRSLDVDLFCQTHNSMVEAKNLSHLKVDRQHIESLRAQFGHLLKMSIVYQEQTALASALIITFADMAYYYLAGASKDGRDLNASFLMVDELLKNFKAEKMKEFDFGGITPFKKDAAGVNRFKMGFGGKVIHYVGERNLCKSKILTTAFDYVISKKL